MRVRVITHDNKDAREGGDARVVFWLASSDKNYIVKETNVNNSNVRTISANERDPNVLSRAQVDSDKYPCAGVPCLALPCCTHLSHELYGYYLLEIFSIHCAQTTQFTTSVSHSVFRS